MPRTWRPTHIELMIDLRRPMERLAVEAGKPGQSVLEVLSVGK
jgi:hypothetical protein